MTRTRRMCTLALVALLGAAISAPAQVTTGLVTGTIKDEQGGVIPGATVVLISEARGTRSAPATTDDNGDFVFPNVSVDTYTIEVTMPSFKTLRRPGVAVSAGSRVTAGILTIGIGVATETVEVKAVAPVIQAASGPSRLPPSRSRTFRFQTAASRRWRNWPPACQAPPPSVRGPTCRPTLRWTAFRRWTRVATP